MKYFFLSSTMLLLSIGAQAQHEVKCKAVLTNLSTGEKFERDITPVNSTGKHDFGDFAARVTVEGSGRRYRLYVLDSQSKQLLASSVGAAPVGEDNLVNLGLNFYGRHNRVYISCY
jgi:hypothetical protein